MKQAIENLKRELLILRHQGRIEIEGYKEMVRLISVIENKIKD